MFVEGTKSQIEKCIDMEMGKIHYITGIILSFCCLINVGRHKNYRNSFVVVILRQCSMIPDTFLFTAKKRCAYFPCSEYLKIFHAVIYRYTHENGRQSSKLLFLKTHFNVIRLLNFQKPEGM